MQGSARVPILLLTLAAAMILAAGCTTVRTSNPPRTATEQFLMSHAAKDAIEPLGLEPFADRRVYLEPPNLQVGTADERAYMIGQLRARLVQAGARLVPTPEEAEVILEFRSGALGIDRNELKIGAPANTAAIAIRVVGGPSLDIVHPELNIVHAHRQWGAGSAALVAYWKDTGDIAAFTRQHVGRSVYERWKVILLGSRTISDVPTTIDPQAVDTEDLLESDTP